MFHTYSTQVLGAIVQKLSCPGNLLQMIDEKLITTLKEVAHIPGILGFIIVFTKATAIRCPD